VPYQPLCPVFCVAAAPWLVFIRREGVDIQDAYKLLSPTLGARGASIIFALALLASGQNSTITGTLAGQVVMEGFLQVRCLTGLWLCGQVPGL
jgi:manganese transport protein